MKKILLAMFLLAVFPSYALADEVVRQLPGNATIVTDPDRPPRGVIILNNDESVLYRALVGRDRQRNYYNANPSAATSLRARCEQENRTSSSRSACVRRAIREHEHGIND